MSIGTDPKSLAGRPTEKAELLGQILTPPSIAQMMVRYLMLSRPESSVSILDPAVGPGTFPQAIASSGLLGQDDQLTVYDIDTKMISQTRPILENVKCRKQSFCQDYLVAEIAERYDMVIMNPPYVRQEWLENKKYYQNLFTDLYGVQVPGTSNLYVYFVLKALADLKPGGKLVCIVYDSWLYTRFGRWLDSIIEVNCEQLDIVPVGAQPFHRRLIDASIIIATRSTNEHISNQSKQGADLFKRNTPFTGVEGFKRIVDLFHTKRGLRLKQANFFLTESQNISRLGATPFVKKPAKITGYIVPENHSEAALLIHPDSTPNKRILEELETRLSMARKNPGKNISILTWYAERPDTWYLHRPAPYAPILFNYYLRHRPRHISNPKRYYADNFYGLTPISDIDIKALVALLNSTCVCSEILYRVRNQGSGLAKVQLYEYRETWIPDWTSISNQGLARLKEYGDLLINVPNEAQSVFNQIDEVISSEFTSENLTSQKLQSLYEEARNTSFKQREYICLG